MCEIRVDYRERLLLGRLQARPDTDLTFVSAALEVGDVLGTNFVIERKTRADFVSSLQNGRLKTQRDRMRELPEHCRVVLVERESTACSTHDDPCMIGLFASDCAKNQGTSSLSVCCVESTCRFIVRLAKLLSDDAKRDSVAGDALMYLTPRAHCRTLLKRMGEEGGGHRGLLGFLLSLEGVGRARALAVTREYGSLRQLIQRIGATDVNMNIQTADEAGTKKRRRITCGPATTRTILTALGFEPVVGGLDPTCIANVNIDPEDGDQAADDHARPQHGLDGHALSGL
jgi:ERCC4-type nuclease